MRAAGGQVLALSTKKVQFVVREAFREPGAAEPLQRGILPEKGTFKVHSKMHNGMIYIDGAQVRYRFVPGVW